MASYGNLRAVDELAFLLDKVSMPPRGLSPQAKVGALQTLVKLGVARKDPKFTSLNEWASLLCQPHEAKGQRFCDTTPGTGRTYLPLVTFKPMPSPINPVPFSDKPEDELPTDVISEHLVLMQPIAHTPPEVPPIFMLWQLRWKASRPEVEDDGDMCMWSLPVNWRAESSVLGVLTEEELGKLLCRKIEGGGILDPLEAAMYELGGIETARMRRSEIAYKEACERSARFWSIYKNMDVRY